MLALVTEDIVFLAILSIGNIPIYILINKVLFGGWEELKDAFAFLLGADFYPSVYDLQYTIDNFTR